MSRFQEWPVVPEVMRPKPLYYCEDIPDADLSLLKVGGWEPHDVRLMPESTDDERELALKAFLQGVRLGSITPDKGAIQFVELEAKILGLLAAKKEAAKTGPDPDDLDALLGPVAARNKAPRRG